jgi:hypothetical protein
MRSCYSIDIPLAGSEAGLLLGAFRIKGAGRRFGTARCGSVLILPPYACREYYKVELTGYRRVPRRRMVQ